MPPESTDTAVAALGEPPVSVETLYRSIETRLRETRPKEDLAPLERAYRFASQRHLGQMRVSGEPYMTHPLLVTGQLVDMHMDMDLEIGDRIRDTGVNGREGAWAGDYSTLVI